MEEVQQSAIARRVFNQDLYNLHVADFMVGQTKRFIDPEKSLVDVGAATGLYSTFWAPLAKHLYLYEAAPVVYKQTKLLEEQFDNVTVYNKAVSDEQGVVDFYLDAKRLSNNSLQKLVDGPKVSVPCVRLDDEDFPPIGFLKIDVEGFEHAVLKGALGLIERDKPNCMIEIYPKFSSVSSEEMFNFFFSRGYKCYYNIRGKGLVEVSSASDGAKIADHEDLWAVHDCDFLFEYIK